METMGFEEGASSLLGYSMVADRARLALTHAVDPTREVSDDDRAALQRAMEFLSRASTAQEAVDTGKMQGFTIEGSYLRQATYDAGKTATTGEHFQLRGFLTSVDDTLKRVKNGEQTDNSNVEIAQKFMSCVRDVFRARSAPPMEIVREMMGAI